MHGYFIDRLVPVCAQLLDAATAAGEIRSDVSAYELMRGVGNLCIGTDTDPRYDARRLIDLLVAGLQVPDGDVAALRNSVDSRSSNPDIGG